MARHPDDPAAPVCVACGHKHRPAERHADHQWDDGCLYLGTDCAAAADRVPRGPAAHAVGDNNLRALDPTVGSTADPALRPRPPLPPLSPTPYHRPNVAAVFGLLLLVICCALLGWLVERAG